MIDRLRAQTGQTATEYLGVVLVAATIVSVILSPSSGIAEAISGQVERAFCTVAAGEESCATAKDSASTDGDRPPGSRPGDLDGDGLSDEAETQGGTNPNAADVDRDGLSDAEERRRGSDPNSAPGAAGQREERAERPDRRSEEAVRDGAGPPDAAQADGDGDGLPDTSRRPPRDRRGRTRTARTATATGSPTPRSSPLAPPPSTRTPTGLSARPVTGSPTARRSSARRAIP